MNALETMIILQNFQYYFHDKKLLKIVNYFYCFHKKILKKFHKLLHLVFVNFSNNKFW